MSMSTVLKVTETHTDGVHVNCIKLSGVSYLSFSLTGVLLFVTLRTPDVNVKSPKLSLITYDRLSLMSFFQQKCKKSLAPAAQM